jgi:uncharacterized membrane protein
MKEYIIRLFADATGEPSSKRWVGTTAAIAGAVFGAIGNYEAMTGCFSLSAACLAITPFEKK